MHVGFPGLGVMSTGGPTLTYGSFSDQPTAAVTHNFTGMAIGTASAARYVIAVISGARNIGVTVSSCTIGGIAATEIYEAGGAANQVVVSFWIALVPTGTTATVSATFTASTAAWCSTYSVTGLGSTTAYDTAVDLADASSVMSADIDVQDGGFIIAAVGSVTSGTWTWSGTAGVVENYDSVVNAAWSTSGASISGAVAGTAKTVTVTASGTVSWEALAAISMK